MRELIKDAVTGMPWYMHAILWVCVVLVVAGFLVPPIGVIDSSVLTAVGEILGGAWLFFLTASIPTYIEKGATIRASKGDASIEIGK